MSPETESSHKPGQSPLNPSMADRPEAASVAEPSPFSWRPYALTGLIMLFMIVLRVLVGTLTAYQAAEEQRLGGHLDEAVVQYERAIHWYLPMNPWGEKAAEALRVLGIEAEAKGDDALAMSAWEAVRGAIYATRSFYTPMPERLAEANQHIAQLMLRVPGGRWPDPSLSPEARHKVAMERLNLELAPHPGWSFLAVTGFLGWVSAAAGFFLRSFSAEGHFLAQPGRQWGLGIVIGYACWIVGLMKA